MDDNQLKIILCIVGIILFFITMMCHKEKKRVKEYFQNLKKKRYPKDRWMRLYKFR